MAREYLGHILRDRLDEKVRPPRTALLVVDMQNDFVHGDGLCARAFGPDLVSGFQSVIGPIARLAAAAREAGVVVIYEVYRDGAVVANVAQPGYTDTGLAPASTHGYRIRAYDTSNNASAQTSPTPTPSTTPAPEIMSVSLTATPITGCKVALVAVVMASAPMAATLTYNVNGASGSVPLTFTTSDLTQSVPLPDGDALLAGIATASAGAVSDSAVWLTCLLGPPSPDPSTP